SGYMLETALASGLCSMGVDVLLCGPLPTPAISNLTVSMRADAGAVISASHNPYDDNGIKFFSADGFKLPDEVEAEIEDLIVIGNSPDGKNINRGFGALHPETMCKAVKKTGANLGVALDGDADRVVVSDEQGNVVHGDAVIAICGLDLLKRKALAKRTVVATVMSNMGLDKAIEKAGGRVVRTKVGDRYVVEEMRNGGYVFGGEQSGHLVFLDSAT